MSCHVCNCVQELQMVRGIDKGLTDQGTPCYDPWSVLEWT